MALLAMEGKGSAGFSVTAEGKTKETEKIKRCQCPALLLPFFSFFFFWLKLICWFSPLQVFFGKFTEETNIEGRRC